MARNSVIRRSLAARADEGLQAAFDGAMAVLKDAKAPPTSKASASGSMIKIYELLVRDDSEGKEAADMTYDEIQEEIARIRRQAADAPNADEGPGQPDPGVFD